MELFKDKAAIVTGGASGIGRAVSQELVRQGARVTLVDINTELLKQTVEALSKTGGAAKAAVLDVREFDAVKKLVDDTVAEQGKLDYIFNNAGVVIFGEARDFSIDDWRTVIDTNLYGVVNGVAAAYPIMVKQGFGHIVNTASLAGLVPVSGLISYIASKYGVVGLSNALRVEGADLGVKVSVVCPGLIDTGMKGARMIKLDREKALAASPKLLPAEECARVIIDGVRRNKAIITVTALAKISYLLQRISPRFMLWFLIRVHTKRMRKLRIEDWANL